jgi:hypothetical protein
MCVNDIEFSHFASHLLICLSKLTYNIIYIYTSHLNISYIHHLAYIFSSPSHLIFLSHLIFERNDDTNADGCVYDVEFIRGFVGDFSYYNDSGAFFGRK